MNDLFALPAADLNAELGHDLAVLPTGWPEKGIRPHPFAAINRMMTPDEFAELKTSVNAQGLLEKIVIFEDKILDGRNRFLAGIADGRFAPNVDWRTHPDFVEFGGKGWDGDRGTDALSFVWNMEVRRHRSARDTALAAARYLRFVSALKPTNEAEKTVKLRLPTQADLAKRHGISERLVHSALMLLERAEPEVVKAVEENRMSLTDAADVVSRLDPVEQRSLAEAPDRKTAKRAVKATKARPIPKAPDLPSPISRTDLMSFVENVLLKANVAYLQKGQDGSVSAETLLQLGREHGIIEKSGAMAWTRPALLAMGKLRDFEPAKPKKKDKTSPPESPGPVAPPRGGEWAQKVMGLKGKSDRASIEVFHEEDDTFSMRTECVVGSTGEYIPFEGAYPTFLEAVGAAADRVLRRLRSIAAAMDGGTTEAMRKSADAGAVWLQARVSEWGIALPSPVDRVADQVADIAAAMIDQQLAYQKLVDGQGALKGKHTMKSAEPILRAADVADIPVARQAVDLGTKKGSIAGWRARLGLQRTDRSPHGPHETFAQ